MNYVSLALTGMVGYSFVTLFVKLATRSGHLSGFLVTAIGSLMVAIVATSIAIGRGDMRFLAEATAADFSYAVATGFAMTIAVTSLFQALSLGPASIVVPIYGMFIMGGATLGMLVLREPLTVYKLVGIGLAAASIYFITTSPGRH
jgi:transporter family protein